MIGSQVQLVSQSIDVTDFQTRAVTSQGTENIATVASMAISGSDLFEVP